MTRFGIDALAAIRLAEEGRGAADGDQLVAPAILRSDALRILYAQVRAGEREQRQALDLVRVIASTPMRVLGDKVSMRTAFTIAAALDLEDPGPAAYLSVTRLQADALVALDPAIAALAEGVVPTAPWEALAR
ncbi:hypothetical protein [Amnibacterium kyonggiense]|uniref:Nucleic acid-binding protein n=1 Tax=Amnibacterium kyonggiense TaxID=595671 RepID=A0A4R7FMJ2_9MICO|nr:hypothetical protein [Amnibacterium kyonggiense]TDS77692.1 hypothetical protein CLV52_2652 [Amnibacterium kyonggiense]